MDFSNPICCFGPDLMSPGLGTRQLSDSSRSCLTSELKFLPQFAQAILLCMFPKSCCKSSLTPLRFELGYHEASMSSVTTTYTFSGASVSSSLLLSSHCRCSLIS